MNHLVYLLIRYFLANKPVKMTDKDLIFFLILINMLSYYTWHWIAFGRIAS